MLELVSHALCPYVQRAVIALTEKNASFKRTDVDLSDRPAWFVALSPLGKVPLLRVGDDVIFESAVILEYLEDTVAPTLHPKVPLERARHRSWIEFASSALNDVWGFYVAPDAAAMEAKRQALRDKFSRVEAALGEGPYFAGASFGLVDAAFAPVFRYWDTFDQIADFGVFEGLPKVRAWRTALAQRFSVQAAVGADYPQRLAAFLRERHSHLSSLMA